MVQKLRVLFFQSQDFFGSDSMIHSLLMGHFNRDRVEVHVACTSGQGSSRPPSLEALGGIPDVHVVPTNFGPSINSRSIRDIGRSTLTSYRAVADLSQLALYIRRHGIDVIHGTEKPRDAFYGTLMAKATGVKSVVHLHVKYEDWISRKSQWALSHCDAIIGVSNYIARTAVEAGHDPRRVFSVVNSIEASRWDPDTDGMRVRAELGIDAHAPVLAVVSRLFSWKGHTELIRALSRVAEVAPSVRLLIVGEDDQRGNPSRGSYTAELRAIVSELNLEENVIFTGHRSDIQNIMAAADIYTMPTFEEPCAVVFLEAMAMKKPVVALDSGGTPEEIEHGRSGLLSAPGDIGSLAENIVSLVRDPETRHRMGEYGRARVEDYFNPGRMADEVEAVYREILTRRTVNANVRAEMPPPA